MDDAEAIKAFYENLWTTKEENLYQAKLIIAAESICLSFKVLQSSKLKFV